MTVLPLLMAFLVFVTTLGSASPFFSVVLPPATTVAVTVSMSVAVSVTMSTAVTVAMSSAPASIHHAALTSGRFKAEKSVKAAEE